jgi:hypothetical protein
MAVPHGKRFEIPFDEMFPEGAYLIGEVTGLTEYQSGEDKARNRPVRPRLDEATGKRLYRVMVADPSGEKEREKSITVEIAADVQPVPPEAIPGTPIRPVVLEGLTVQPRAESSGQAKWITWTVRATGLRSPVVGSTQTAGGSKSTAGKPSPSGEGAKSAA